MKQSDHNLLRDYINSQDRLKFYEDAVEPSAAYVLAMIALMLVGVLGLWWLSFPENVDWLMAFLGIA